MKINSILKGKHLKQKIAGSRCILLVGILLLSAGLGTALAGGSSDGGSVIVTVERQVLGEGFFLEPKAVDFNAGDGGREIVKAALGADGVELSDTGITAIVGADTGSVAIPEAVQVLTTATLPSADNPELAKGAATLGNGAYASAGHWNLTLNGKKLDSLLDYTPQDGDILRIRYSLFEEERDLELSKNAGDIDRILELVAQTDRNDQSNNQACTTALEALSKVDITGKEARAAFGVLEDALYAHEVVEPSEASVSEDPAVPVPTVAPTPTPTVDDQASAQTDAALQAALSIQADSLMATQSDNAVDTMINSSAAALLKGFEKYPPTVGTTGGEWSILVLARSGLGTQNLYDTYYDNVCQTLIDKQGVLDKRKYTEYSRVILGLTAIGKDVTNVAGYNLLSYLTDFNNVKFQGINGPIWALIALDSHSYEIPNNPEAKTQNSRQTMVNYILDREVDGGGWTLSGTKADPDITAMALYALQPYQSQPAVKAACDRAFAVLSALQVSSGEDAGCYSTYGTNNLESTAQVVMALSAYGIDPETDSRFIKNGVSTVDAISKFYMAESSYGAGFMHIKPGGGDNGGAAPGVRDAMATDQGMEALITYTRVQKGQTQIFNMNDIAIDKSEVMGMYLNVEKGVFTKNKESSIQLTATPDYYGTPDMSAVVWSVENHTGTSIVAVDGKGLVTVHPSSLSQGQLAAMGLSPDVPIATVTATITVDRTRKISASYDVYQGITPQGIAELIDAMPTPSQVDAENKDTVLFISRAMGQLSSADEQYLTGTLLTSAEKQKLEYAQAGVKKLNQTLIKTYAMDDEGKRVYPKTFKIYSDLPWNVALHVEDLNAETLEKMEKGLSAKETILQANAIYLTDTLADDPDNRYELPEGTSVKIQMEVPETTKSAISSVKVNRYEGTAADNLSNPESLDMTLSIDRRYVTFDTNGFSPFAYIVSKASTITPGTNTGGNSGGVSGSTSTSGSTSSSTSTSSTSSTNFSTRTTGTAGTKVDHGLTLGQSGIGMVDITGTGKLKTDMTTPSSFWNALWNKIKEGAAPFAIGLGTMAVLYSVGVLIVIEIRHKRGLKL